LLIKDRAIVLRPIQDEATLEELLAGSPKECFAVTDEDREWMDETPSGKEV